MLAAGTDARHEFQVATCGALARALFVEGRRGHVTAVFERSFYVEDAGRMACIVGSDAGAGPLNLVVAMAQRVNWRASGLRVGAPVHFVRAGCAVAHRFRFDTSAAAAWAPPVPAGRWNGATLRIGLAALRGIVAAQVPVDGLGRLALEADRRGDRTLLMAHAEPRVATLADNLDNALAAPDRITPDDFIGARGLLGLGPGLTPAGDDFLGGIMIALHLVGQDAIGAALWQALAPAAVTRTHAIARAHLAGAAQGMGSASVHDVLNAVLEGRSGELATACRDLDRLGHTSGWDILAGAVTALDAVGRGSSRCRERRRETTAVPD